MKQHALVGLVALIVGGCNRPSPPANAPQMSRDNTGVNVRDRDPNMKTPINQNENRQDVDITANIRKQVVDSQMSVDAQNVKIITQDGHVTLRGPVKSADEKRQIEQIAQRVAGENKVDSQLEVEPQR